MNKNKMNSPFFARFLECSIEDEMQDVRGQKDDAIAITSVQNDQISTAKYPSDDDEHVTYKYPSDTDEHITHKYPSDNDDHIIDDDIIASTK